MHSDQLLVSNRAATPVQYRLNIRLCIVSTLVLLIGSAAAYYWHQRQLVSLADSFIDRASQLETSQDWSAAASYVYRYLQVHPDDSAAKVRLAELYDKSLTHPSQRSRAIELYYQAIGSVEKAKRASLRTRLAELLVDSGRFDEALTVVGEVRAEDPRNAKALLGRALILYQKYEAGQASKSTESIEEVWQAMQAAIEHNATDVVLCSAMASVLRRKPELLRSIASDKEELSKQADQIMDRLVTLAPQRSEALLARYAYRVEFKLPGAEEDLAAALDNSPNDAKVYMIAAQQAFDEALLNQKDEKFDQAMKLVLRLIELSPNDGRAYLLHGQLLNLRGERKLAADVWRTGITKSPRDSLDLQLALARSLVVQGDVKEAKEVMRSVEEKIQGLASRMSAGVRLQLQSNLALWRGVLAYRQGDLRQAERELKQVTLRQTSGSDEVDGIVQAWLLLGEIYSKWQHWDRAALAYEAALQQKPQLAVAQEAAARCWRYGGRPDRAAVHLTRMINNSPTAELYLGLAENELELQRQKDAKQRQWSTFEQAVAEAKRLGGADKSSGWKVLVVDARYHFLRALDQDDVESPKHEELGLRLLSEAEGRFVDSPECLRRLAVVYEAVGRVGDADRLRTILAATKSFGVDAVLTQAEIAVRRGDTQEAARIIQTALAMAPTNDRISLQTALDRLPLVTGDPQDAYSALENSYSKDPGNLDLLRRLAELCIVRRQWAELESKWEPRLKELQGDDSPDWLFYRGTRLVNQSESATDERLQEAEQLVSQLKLTRPEWSSSYVAQAQLEQRRGKYDLAIRYYRQALGVGEMRLAVHQALLQLLRSERRFAEADELLTAIRQKSAVTSPVLDSLELSMSLELGQIGRGLELARKGVAARPNDSNAYQWLGEMLLLSKEEAEAEVAFQKAVDLKPTDATNWIALFQFYVRTQQFERAAEALESLKSKSSLSEGQKCFALAQGFEMLQKPDLAEQYYRMAERLNPDSEYVLMRIARYYQKRDPATAIEVLRRVTRISPQSRESLHSLILLLAARGTEGDWNEIDRLWRDDPTASDLRLKSILTLRRPGADCRASLAHSRQLLDQAFAEEKPPSDETRRLIIQVGLRQASLATKVEERQSLLRECHDHLRSLAAQEKASASSIAEYIDFLLRYDSAARAREWLPKLASTHSPDEIIVRARLISYLLQREFFEEANRELTALENVIDTLDAQPAAIAIKIFAGLCVDAKMSDRVKGRLAKLAVAFPEDLEVVALQVSVHHASKDNAEVRRVIDAYQSHIGPRVKSKVQQTQCSIQLAELYRRAELTEDALRHYQQAYDSNPNAAVALLPALVSSGRFTDAVRICREGSGKNKSPDLIVVLLQTLISNLRDSDGVAMIEPLIAESLEAHPHNTSLLLSVAVLRTFQNEASKAEQLYRRVLSRDPNNLVALNNLAVLLAEHDSTSLEAVDMVDRALVLAGTNDAVLDSKGLVCMYRGETQAAIELLTAAASLPSKDPRHHLHLAAALANVHGKEVEARSELAKALKLGVETSPLSSKESGMLKLLRQNLLSRSAIESPGNVSVFSLAK